jgi:hypothetical protein
VVGRYEREEAEKVAARGEVSLRGARGTFYRPGDGVERSGGGGQAAAGGAPLTCWLLEETTRWPFDFWEMKRRCRRIGSYAQRVVQVLDAAAMAEIRFDGGSIWREVGDEGGSSWAKLGQAGSREKGAGQKKERVVLGIGCRKFLSNFLRVLSLKSMVLNTFKLNLNWGQIGINSSKLFDGFSNIELLEIDFNIQIQTKALIGRLLNWFEKIFQNKNLNLFEKMKITKGLEIKICMPWNASYEIFLLLFR